MGKFNQYLPVEVTCKDTQAGEKMFSFFGIKPSDMQDVLGRLIMPGGGPFAKPNPAKNIEKVWSKSGALFVIVKPDKLDAFYQTGLNSIISALIKSGNYDNDGILHLQDEVPSAADTMSKAQMDQLYKDAAASEIDMWTNYLNKIDDPETRKILELYSQIYGNTIYGHALSLKNAMTIRNINPDATFVLGKTTWASFGRGVKAGAKKYPLWGRSFKDVATADDIKAAQDALGQGLEDFGELGVAVQQAIKIQANKNADKNKGKIPVPFRYIGYDIADTYVYQTKDADPLKSKPNISSNVIYTLNQLAQEAEAKKEAERGKEIEGDTEMKDKTALALEEVQHMCDETGVKSNVSDGAEPSSALATLLVQYYTPIVTKKANVLKNGAVAQYAEDATQLTLIMNNIALDQLNRFRHSIVYTQKEAAALAPIIRTATYRIGRAINNKINEDVENDRGSFLVQYKDALKKLGIKIVKSDNELPEGAPMTREELKESFFKTLNKIETNYFFD